MDSLEVLSDVVYIARGNRLQIMDSYKITSKKKMRDILEAIVYKHKIQFNRTTNELIREGVAHNRMYKLNIRRDKTKDVDLTYNESKRNTIIYNILGI